MIIYVWSGFTISWHLRFMLARLGELDRIPLSIAPITSVSEMDCDRVYAVANVNVKCQLMVRLLVSQGWIDTQIQAFNTRPIKTLSILLICYRYMLFILCISPSLTCVLVQNINDRLRWIFLFWIGSSFRPTENERGSTAPRRLISYPR